MDHLYPAVPLSWALKISELTPTEFAYGVQIGFLLADAEHPTLAMGPPLPVAMNESELAAARDVLFGSLMVNLHKQWFSLTRPCEAYEFLARDFEDCPSTSIGDGMVLAGIDHRGQSAQERWPTRTAAPSNSTSIMARSRTPLVKTGRRPPADPPALPRRLACDGEATEMRAQASRKAGCGKSARPV